MTTKMKKDLSDFEKFMQKEAPLRFLAAHPTGEKKVYDVEDLSGTGVGKRCVVVGHGYSAEYATIPESFDVIAANSTEFTPRVNFIVGFDTPVLIAIEQGTFKLNPDTKIIAPVYWGEVADYQYQWNRYPMPKPPWTHYRTGTRCVYIAAETMKYDEVYLVGYDYEAHPPVRTQYEVRNWTMDRPPEQHQLILNDQLREFDAIDWTGTIYQTNDKSFLKRFPIKKLPIR